MTQVIIKNIHAQDQIPFPATDLIPLPIANAYGSANSLSDPGLILSPDESARWRCQGIDEYVFLELPSIEKVHRMIIEWDPLLPREGRYEIDFIQSVATPQAEAVVQTLMVEISSLFTVIESETGYLSSFIKIIFLDEGLHGIANVKLWTR